LFFYYLAAGFHLNKGQEKKVRKNILIILFKILCLETKSLQGTNITKVSTNKKDE